MIEVHAITQYNFSKTKPKKNCVISFENFKIFSVVETLKYPLICRFYTQLDNLHNYIEVLDHELSKEVQNGRLFRLMVKLATINERPDFNMEATWAETGDR